MSSFIGHQDFDKNYFGLKRVGMSYDLKSFKTENNKMQIYLSCNYLKWCNLLSKNVMGTFLYSYFYKFIVTHYASWIINLVEIRTGANFIRLRTINCENWIYSWQWLQPYCCFWGFFEFDDVTQRSEVF